MKVFQSIMVTALSASLLFAGVPTYATPQDALIDSLMATGLTVVAVETVDGEEPTCEYLKVEDGYPANTIRNATKVPGRVVVMERGDTLFDSGTWEKDVSGMTIKMRGNNSAYRQKHPFKVKLQKKADMLARGDEDKYKDKDWVLLDGSTLNLMVGMEVSRLMGLQWTPAYRYVNLLINGDYRGIYILCESVKRNPSCRLDVSKDEGFIVENDPFWWKEDVYVKSWASNCHYTLLYPDPDDVTEEQLTCAQSRLSTWEQSTKTGTYDELIDVDSFAAWLLTHDILGNDDAAGSNIFLTWYDSGSKIQMGNIWDLDTNYFCEDQWARIHYWSGFFFGYMLESNNQSLATAYIEKWEEVGAWLFSQMEAKLDSFLLSDGYWALERSRDLEKVHVAPMASVAYGVEQARQWFSRRKAWLDGAILEMKDQMLTSNVQALPLPKDSPYGQTDYWVDGKQISQDASPARLRIRRGRKYISK